jgi:hypothetical protein
MPIRLNLLAEAQALEEDRRRDPVKRAALVGAMVVLIVGSWCGYLQMRVVFSRSDLNSLQSRWSSIDKKYQVAVENQRKTLEAESRLASLHQLATNRFLWGNVLNAFQQIAADADGIQLARLRVEQVYAAIDGTSARTNDDIVIPGKPSGSAERIVITLDALDTSTPAGSQVVRFKDVIATNSFFQGRLQKTNGLALTALSAPQLDPVRKSPYVTFTLQCNFPEKVR